MVGFVIIILVLCLLVAKNVSYFKYIFKSVCSSSFQRGRYAGIWGKSLVSREYLLTLMTQP